MTLRDRISSTMKSIISSGQPLSKEFEDLYARVEQTEASQTALAKKIAETRTSITRQTDTVKQAKTAWNDLRREKTSTAEQIEKAAATYQEEAERLENLKNELNEYTEASKDAKQSIRDMSTEWRKMRQDMASGDAGSGISGAVPDVGASSGGAGVLSALKQAGVTKLLGDAVTQVAGTAVDSLLGQPTASLVSSIASGAVSGAALGSIIPGLGTLVGGAIGAGAGLLTGGTQVFQAQDDAFGSYYQEAAETALADQSTAISSGSTIAGGREQTRMAFARRLGSDQAADEFLDEVKSMAATTNYSYDEITGYAKSLLNSYSAEEIFGVLQSLSDATAGLDLSSSDVSMMISGLSRMRTTGKANQEYLNYFSERGVDVYQALANATGADRSQIAEMVSDGQIGGVEAAQAILDYINETFGGLSEDLSHTYDAMVDNLADAEANLQERAGQGYNEERSRGIAEQQQWLEDNESSLGDAYSMIGQWQASLENTKARLEREAMDAVMSGVISESFAGSDQRERLEEMAAEYQAALADYEAGNEEAGATMGRLLAEAQVIAMNEYNASDGAQLALESELSLAESIREDAASNKAYWDAGYRKGEEYSKGLAAGIFGGADAGATPDTSGAAFQHPMLKNSLSTEPQGYAVGLDYVPYDNFPALLHQGERVLTANEARAQDREGGRQIVVNISGEWHVRSDADVDAIAGAIADKLLLAQMAG